MPLRLFGYGKHLPLPKRFALHIFRPETFFNKRPNTAKQTMTVKKVHVMYAILFTTQDPAIQVALPIGKSVNAKFY